MKHIAYYNAKYHLLNQIYEMFYYETHYQIHQNPKIGIRNPVSTPQLPEEPLAPSTLDKVLLVDKDQYAVQKILQELFDDDDDDDDALKHLCNEQLENPNTSSIL